MTNPNNAVGTNGAFNGRTSVNAFNDGIAAFTSGVMSGWVCEPSSGMTVTLGGNGSVRDVAIAEDNIGNKTTINNISGSPISVTLEAAPATNSRIDSIVAYVDNPPTGSPTATDNPEACGLIVVEGNVAANPTAPNDTMIRTAITADGASGTTAYYVVLANVTVENGTTDITNEMIMAGGSSGITAQNINPLSFEGGVDGNGFHYFYLANGKRVWTKSWVVWRETIGNWWSGENTDTPMDFQAKDIAVGSTVCGDRAITATLSKSGDHIELQRVNHYGSTVATNIYCTLIAIEM